MLLNSKRMSKSNGKFSVKNTRFRGEKLGSTYAQKMLLLKGNEFIFLSNTHVKIIIPVVSALHPLNKHAFLKPSQSTKTFGSCILLATPSYSTSLLNLSTLIEQLKKNVKFNRKRNKKPKYHFYKTSNDFIMRFFWHCGIRCAVAKQRLIIGDLTSVILCY